MMSEYGRYTPYTPAEVAGILREVEMRHSGDNVHPVQINLKRGSGPHRYNTHDITGPESIVYLGPSYNQGRQEPTCLPLTIANTISALGLEVDPFLLTKLLNQALRGEGNLLDNLDDTVNILTEYGYETTYTDKEDLLLHCQSTTNFIKEQLEQRAPIIALVTGSWFPKEKPYESGHVICIVGRHSSPSLGERFQVLDPNGYNRWVPDWQIEESAVAFMTIAPLDNAPRRNWYQKPMKTPLFELAGFCLSP